MLYAWYHPFGPPDLRTGIYLPGDQFLWTASISSLSHWLLIWFYNWKELAGSWKAGENTEALILELLSDVI